MIDRAERKNIWEYILSVLDNGLWSVVEFLHVKPGKGAAFVRSKLKNVETGQVVEKTFRAGEKVAKAMLDRREMQYLYKEGKEYVMICLLYTSPSPRD